MHHPSHSESEGTDSHAAGGTRLAAGGANSQAMKRINWSVVDWRKPVRQIAQELGCTRQAVYLAQARRWGAAEESAPRKKPRAAQRAR